MRYQELVKLFCCTLLISAASFSAKAQVCGCTDPLATNYNANATVNDGSCTYASTTISATSIGELDETLNGTSGMIYWNGGYWTYNDHTDTHLYQIDSTTASIIGSLQIAPSGNYDTEEISQDSLYLYFGDIGNNSGTRTNLHILRISKQGLIDNDFVIDTIFFSYADQTDFTSSPQATDFDCESFIVGEDSIFVFTKQWVSEGTVCYGFPKEPGTYEATARGTCNVGGLITGATYIPDKRIVVLCGYSSTLQPFIYLLYDFQGEDFFSGNKRKLSFSMLVRDQVEAIATSDALHYYITNEYFVYQSIITRPSKLQVLDLSSYLEDYIESLNVIPADSTSTDTTATDTTHIIPESIVENIQNILTIAPNPVCTELHLQPSEYVEGAEYLIYNMKGQRVDQGVIRDGMVSTAVLSQGEYILVVSSGKLIYRGRFIKW